MTQPFPPFAPAAASATAPDAAPPSLEELWQGRGAADDATKLPALPQGGHEAVSVSEVRTWQGTFGRFRGIWFFGATLTVVRSSLCPPGTTGSVTFQLTGFEQESYAQREYARLRSFLASLVGEEFDRAEVKEKFSDPSYAAGVQRAAERGEYKHVQPACEVTHVTTGSGKVLGRYKFRPAGTSVAGAPPPAATPTPTPTPAPAPAEKPWPPPGWAADPVNPGMYRGVHNGQPVQATEEQLRAAQQSGAV